MRSSSTHCASFVRTATSATSAFSCVGSSSSAGFEKTEPARLVAKTSERDVGLREPQEPSLARVLRLGADRAERLDDLRPAVDVFVELTQRAQHLDVVRLEVARLLERLDRRARVRQLDALQLREAL